MAKKRDRYVYNFDNVNLEIDYDKLADAIVSAQTKVRDKRKMHLSLRAKAMKFFNGAIYCFIYVIAGAGIYTVWKDYFPAESIPLYGCVIFTALLVFVGGYAFLCQQETFNDNGDDSISHFNTNVALIALIVALIALTKGVG